MNGRQTLRIRDVAEQLDVSYGTAWKLVASGELSSLRIGRCVRVTVSELSRFIADKQSAKA